MILEIKKNTIYLPIGIYLQNMLHILGRKYQFLTFLEMNYLKTSK